MTMLVVMAGCYESDTGGGKTKNCSVIARCEDQPDLNIRLRQVETYYYENAIDEDPSYSDLAQFYYSDIAYPDHWTGGVTYRAVQSDFDYTFDYDVNEFITSSSRNYLDDEYNTAEIALTYNYNPSDLLEETISSTIVKDIDEILLKTIDETITYTYSSGTLTDINFDGDDSVEGTYSFDLEFTYLGDLITQIEHTNDMKNGGAGDPDYIFKTFQYDLDDKLVSSKTYGLNTSDELVELESITYQYYQDGPLKTKTSLLTATIPQQKVVTRYIWESGDCLVNQIFGDRLYPTPEVPDFPCL